jgi:hypothetical protein
MITSEKFPLEGEMHGAVESDFHVLSAAPFQNYQAHWTTEPSLVISNWSGLLVWQRTGFVWPKYNWRGFISPGGALWGIAMGYHRDAYVENYFVTGVGMLTYNVPANSWALSIMWNGWALYALFVKTGSKDPRGVYPKVVDSGPVSIGATVTQMTIEDAT